MPRFELVDFEFARPLDTQGGIRAQSRRGAFGKNWWGETLDRNTGGLRYRRPARQGPFLCPPGSGAVCGSRGR